MSKAKADVNPEEQKQFRAALNAQRESQVCADCGDKDTEWTSHSLGIYLCKECSGVHRNLGTHISKVLSVKLDNWRAEQVEALAAGNAVAAATHEAQLPVGFNKPLPNDPYIMREQWIRAKYDRKDFVAGKPIFPMWNFLFNDDPSTQYAPILRAAPMTLLKQGLLKKGIVPAFFILTANLDLYWFKGDQMPTFDDEPLGTLNLAGAVITVENEGANAIGAKTPKWELEVNKQHLFLQSNDPPSHFDWVHAIQLAIVTFTNLDPRSGMVTFRPEKEGQFEKEGANRKNWLKRFFVLKGSALFYFVNQKDVFPKGVCLLKGATVTSTGTLDKKLFCFTVTTPDREWHFSAASENEKDEWVLLLMGGASSGQTDNSYRDTLRVGIGGVASASPAGARLHS